MGRFALLILICIIIWGFWMTFWMILDDLGMVKK